MVSIRWAPTTCISRFITPGTWSYKWVSGVMTFMTLLRGALTPLTTGRGPTLYQPQPNLNMSLHLSTQQKSLKHLGFAAAVVLSGSTPKKHSTLSGFFLISSSGRRSRRPPKSGWRKNDGSVGKKTPFPKRSYGTVQYLPASLA